MAAMDLPVPEPRKSAVDAGAGGLGNVTPPTHNGLDRLSDCDSEVSQRGDDFGSPRISVRRNSQRVSLPNVQQLQNNVTNINNVGNNMGMMSGNNTMGGIPTLAAMQQLNASAMMNNQMQNTATQQNGVGVPANVQRASLVLSMGPMPTTPTAAPQQGNNNFDTQMNELQQAIARNSVILNQMTTQRNSMILQQDNNNTTGNNTVTQQPTNTMPMMNLGNGVLDNNLGNNNLLGGIQMDNNNTTQQLTTQQLLDQQNTAQLLMQQNTNSSPNTNPASTVDPLSGRPSNVSQAGLLPLGGAQPGLTNMSNQELLNAIVRLSQSNPNTGTPNILTLGAAGAVNNNTDNLLAQNTLINAGLANLTQVGSTPINAGNLNAITPGNATNTNTLNMQQPSFQLEDQVGRRASIIYPNAVQQNNVNNRPSVTIGLSSNQDIPCVPLPAGFVDPHSARPSIAMPTLSEHGPVSNGDPLSSAYPQSHGPPSGGRKSAVINAHRKSVRKSVTIVAPGENNGVNPPELPPLGDLSQQAPRDIDLSADPNATPNGKMNNGRQSERKSFTADGTNFMDSPDRISEGDEDGSNKHMNAGDREQADFFCNETSPTPGAGNNSRNNRGNNKTRTMSTASAFGAGNVAPPGRDSYYGSWAMGAQTPMQGATSFSHLNSPDAAGSNGFAGARRESFGLNSTMTPNNGMPDSAYMARQKAAIYDGVGGSTNGPSAVYGCAPGAPGAAAGGYYAISPSYFDPYHGMIPATPYGAPWGMPPAAPHGYPQQGFSTTPVAATQQYSTAPGEQGFPAATPRGAPGPMGGNNSSPNSGGNRGGNMHHMNNTHKNNNSNYPTFFNGVNTESNNTPSSKDQQKLEELRGLIRSNPDEIIRMCADSGGSRKMQDLITFITKHRPADLAVLTSVVAPHIYKLSRDLFGNYVAQRLIEEGNAPERLDIVHHIKGHVYELAHHKYACRVLQKAATHLPEANVVELAEELKGHVVKLAQDQNGNHVVQKIFETARACELLYPEFLGNVLTVAKHVYGCRVLQRMIELHGPAVGALMDEMCRPNNLEMLAMDQYGNYVLQYILTYGRAGDMQSVLQAIIRSTEKFCCHKYASNITEKVMDSYRGRPEIERICEAILRDSPSEGRHDDLLTKITKDSYGNYIIQKLMQLLPDNMLGQLMRALKINLHKLEKSPFGKHIIFALREQGYMSPEEVAKALGKKVDWQ